MFKILLLTLGLCLATSSSFADYAKSKNKNGNSSPTDFWVTLETKYVDNITSKISVKKQIKSGKADVSILQISKDDLDYLAAIMSSRESLSHFMGHETLEDALYYINAYQEKEIVNLFNYTISKQDIVVPAIQEVSEENILKTITSLAAFKNRYYTADTGKQAAEMIKANWEEIIKIRSDISVSFFTHSWKQPSVILTIPGTEFPNEIVVLGGHLDSIAGYFGGASNRAPGADDNASGIAVITEILRLMVKYDYRPARTIQLIGYAGEEAGLLGSKDIARSYKNKASNVVGILNLDMTNYDGSAKDIYLISDNTNATQNNFLGQLIDTYVKTTWGYTSCGYGCSDHASWNTNGYVASYSFESDSKEYNNNIHTSKDLLDVTGGRATHSLHFAKLAFAYALEMGK